MSRKLRIKLISPTKQKLQFVKLIKDYSGLGLRESKDLCDSLHSNPHLVYEMPIRIDFGSNTDLASLSTSGLIKKFISDLKNIDGQFMVNGGVQWERDIKILKLGLADKSEYSDFIKNYIFDSFEDSENILNLALSKLSKDQLEEVFNKIKIEI